MDKKLIAIVPAAGVGARATEPDYADKPKQYRLLREQPMLRWAVLALLADPRVCQVRVIVSIHDTWVDNALINLPRTVWRRCGGATRAETVRNGLRDAALHNNDWVLVHDAARPGLTPHALARLIDTCLATEQGALLALPVADTLKRSVAGGPNAAQTAFASLPSVAHTVDRTELWVAQTPQMFYAGPLLKALNDAGSGNPLLTDEASAMELAGFSPGLVMGSVRNFKVTWPEDFELMERWLP